MMKKRAGIYCFLVFLMALTVVPAFWESILRYSVRLSLLGMETLKGELLSVYYKNPEYARAAETYLKQGEVWLRQTRLLLNAETPADRVSVVLGERPVLRFPSAVFSGGNAAGCYWLDHVFIIKMNEVCPPLSHELAHRVMDEATNGRCPRWFTEGFAQYMEARQAGFMLGEPAPEAMRSPYSFRQLENDFDACPDQKLAYWQAKTAFDALLEKIHWPGIHNLTMRLSQGMTFSDAFEAVTQTDFEQWERDLCRYIT
jgi:hypothetical protein